MELLNVKEMSEVATKGLSTAHDLFKARQRRKERINKTFKEMKQTPIQELTVLVQEVIETAQSREVKRVFKLLEIILAIQAEAEMEFARECFEAGEDYNGKCCGANLEDSPNFDEWFKQYSKQKK